MTANTPARRRARRGLVLALAGMGLLAAGAGAVWIDAARNAAPDASGPVLPRWSEQATDTASLEILASGEAFRLVREDGADGTARWAMPSRGGYRVPPDRLATLDAALSELEFARALTADPARFAALGLDDPDAGDGAGARLIVGDRNGDALADLIVGAASEGVTYVRPASERRAYAARGEMPPFNDPGWWLDLGFFDLEPRDVARAEIDPARADPYTLDKAERTNRDFALQDRPGLRMITAGAGNGVASAGARVRFRDVRPVAELDGQPDAAHAAQTFDGLAYRYDFHETGEAVWATVSVRALSEAAEDRAEALSERVDGWAFEVSADAYERMTRAAETFTETIPDADPDPGED